jgi:zinc transport system substrate-binding protein
MKTIKTISILLVLILGAFVYYNLQGSPKQEHLEQNSSKPLIALSSYALYDVAKNIAGESMNIFSMLPYGVEVHSFEPTPKIMASVNDAVLVVYSGAGLQPWTHTFEDQKNGLDMSRYVKLLDASHEEEGEEHHHHESDFDPHYWLDIDNMIIATNILKEKFIKILPQNQDMYEENAREYIIKLQAIDRSYKEKLTTCKLDTIVVEHNAFSYLANKYNFNVSSISGLSPDAQPSAQVMENILNIVKEKKINTIFFEPFASDKVVKTLAHDAHVEVDMLQPLENITQDEAKKGVTYESLMLENLTKIAKSRECQ